MQQLRTDREKVAHLLRRFGLGASEAEVDYYGAGGLKSAIDKLLDYDKADEGFDVPISKFAQQDNGRLNIRGVQAWWILRLLATRRPLQEKMTLFWHDHFATSASKVNVPPMMYQQNETLRANATGRFQDLLLSVSQDPAMIFWLDNQYNVKGKANENFAREIMELFTLGLGHYSEEDIQEAARAFTGWNLRRNRPAADQQDGNYRFAEFQFRPLLHDTGTKSVLGNKGPFGGEEVVGILCGNPQTSIYLATKIWEWFAYANPEPALIERLAGSFRSNGLQIKLLLRSVMESPEFYSDKAFRAVYKTPVDFVLATVRQLGIGEALIEQLKAAESQQAGRRYQGSVIALQQAIDGLGMELLFPPDVAGWDGGAAWVTSATMVERIGWADRLFGVAPAQAPAKGQRVRAQLRYPALGLFAQDPTPQGIAKKMVSVFDAPIPESKMPLLVGAAEKASGGRVTAQNANQAASAVCKLIFGSPEFQMA